jgi:hypothetical protein
MRRTDRPKDKNKNLYIRATPHKGSNKATAESIEKVIFNQSWGHALLGAELSSPSFSFYGAGMEIDFFHLDVFPARRLYYIKQTIYDDRSEPNE